MNYRNRKLLDIPRNDPYIPCMCCGAIIPNGIVAAHSNQLRDGKGTGIKAHDHRICFVCATCHFELDQGQKTYEEKIEMFEKAHRKTIGWLFENNYLQIK